jgi:hypothetical protein
VASRAASVPTCKLIRQEQFLYFPVLLCMYLTLLQINLKKQSILFILNHFLNQPTKIVQKLEFP